MIHVLAFVSVKPQMMAGALDCYRVLVPKVLACEPGCIEYTPTIDCDLGLPNQELGPCTIVVNERWRSIDDFRAHLAAPHSAEFRASIKPCIEKIVVKVMRPALET
jgi:quinol monooxygenase YgiN